MTRDDTDSEIQIEFDCRAAAVDRDRHRVVTVTCHGPVTVPRVPVMVIES